MAHARRNPDRRKARKADEVTPERMRERNLVMFVPPCARLSSPSIFIPPTFGEANGEAHVDTDLLHAPPLSPSRQAERVRLLRLIAKLRRLLRPEPQDSIVSR